MFWPIASVFIVMTIAFIVASLKKNNGLVDIFWGIAFAVLSWGAYAVSSRHFIMLVVSILITLWALRLSIFLAIRNWNAKEDWRYANWRESWSNFYIRSFFQIYMLQAVIALLLAGPILFIANQQARTSTWLDLIAIAVFLIGLSIEAIADYQKYQFKKKYSRALCQIGLYKYARHPNYFGEMVQWFAIALFAVSFAGGWVMLYSPILLYLLLRYVSGVPMLEARWKKQYKEFSYYRRKTRMFVPIKKFS
ncbi:MAG: DUF1295 domain-containing protein [Candidatus Woesearchaeota archaeon]